jgi:hypothetical protein
MVTTGIIVGIVIIVMAILVKLARERVKKIQKCEELNNLICKCDEALNSLSKCKTLTNILEVHKKAWRDGVRNVNIGPCSWGMYRTEDIGNMSPSEVYLGGIYGLSTKNINFWESMGYDEPYGANGFGIDPEIKLLGNIIVPQYRSQLQSNFEAIKKRCETELQQL